MIYRVIVNDNNISKAIDLFSSIGDFFMVGNVFFIDSPTTQKGFDDTWQVLNITNDNYIKCTACSNTAMNWVLARLQKKELDDYESSEEGQKKLSELNEFLDLMDKAMSHQQLQEK